MVLAYPCLQVQHTPQHLVRMLLIIVDNNCDLAVRQVASIHFKNYIAKNWSPDSGTRWVLLHCSLNYWLVLVA